MVSLVHRYWEYRFQIQIQDSKSDIGKEKNLRFQIEKSIINHFAEGLVAFTPDQKSFIKVFIAICD